MRMQGLRRNTRPTSVLIDYSSFTDIPIEWNSMLNQLDQLGFDGLEVPYFLDVVYRYLLYLDIFLVLKCHLCFLKCL